GNWIPSPALTPAQVRSYSIMALPNGSTIDNEMITYNGGAVGNNYVHVIDGEIANILANSTYTIHVVAQEIATGLFTSVSRIVVTTLPCPPVFLLTGFPIPTVCVNKGQL